MLNSLAHHSPCLLVQHTRSSMGYSSRPCSGNSPDKVMPGANSRRASNRSSTTSSSRLRWVGESLRSALGPARVRIAGSTHSAFPRSGEEVDLTIVQKYLDNCPNFAYTE